MSGVELTGRAARRINDIMAAEPAGSMLRISVNGGGCSGFQYAFDVDQTRQDDDVVVEAAVGAHAVVESVLAGVPERRVPEVVRQRERLGEILVEAEGAGDGAGDLAYLEGVGEPRAVVVALMEDEHLRLMLEPPKGGGVDDPVTVALELAARRRGCFRVKTAPARAGVAGVGRPPSFPEGPHALTSG